MENFNLRAEVAAGGVTLAALNSLTKYPSIETYHSLGEKGVLRELDVDSVAPPASRFTGTVDVTEKIDGTNARVIVLPDGAVVVGSREELLWARGDLVVNPKLRIVETLVDAGVVRAAEKLRGEHVLTVYGEVYGNGIGPGKRYARGGNGTGFRIFDVSYADTEKLTWEPERLASWRQHGGQRWFSDIAVEAVARDLGARRVPVLGSVFAPKLPRTVADTAEWLRRWSPESRAALIGGEKSVASEGVVLRGFDEAGRRLLAKARFEDYNRMLRARR